MADVLSYCAIKLAHMSIDPVTTIIDHTEAQNPMSQKALTIVGLFLVLWLAENNSANAQEDMITMKDYINHIRSEIYELREKESSQPLYISGSMTLEMTVGYKVSGGGGVNFYVFSLDAGVEGFQTQKLTVPISLEGGEQQKVEVTPREGRKTPVFTASGEHLPGNKLFYGYFGTEGIPSGIYNVSGSSPGKLQTPYLENRQILSLLKAGDIKGISGSKVFSPDGEKIGSVINVIYPPVVQSSFTNNATFVFTKDNWPKGIEVILKPNSWVNKNNAIYLTKEAYDALTNLK